MFDHLVATKLNLLGYGLEMCLEKGKASEDPATKPIWETLS